VVEDIITALSHFNGLFVIARNSTFVYKGRAVDVKQVGKDLGVRYVLEGSVRRGGNRLRVSGQLADAATGRHVWSDKIEGSVEEVFQPAASSLAISKRLFGLRTRLWLKILDSPAVGAFLPLHSPNPDAKLKPKMPSEVSYHSIHG
jgi:hypothetical protein